MFVNFSKYILSYKSFYLTTGYTYTHTYYLFCIAIPDFYGEKAYASCGQDFAYIMKSTDRKLVYSFDYSKVSSGFIIPYIIYNSVLYIKEPVIFIWMKLSTILQ